MNIFQPTYIWDNYNRTIFCSPRNYEALKEKYKHRHFEMSVYVPDRFVLIPQKKYQRVFQIPIEKILEL